MWSLRARALPVQTPRQNSYQSIVSLTRHFYLKFDQSQRHLRVSAPRTTDLWRILRERRLSWGRVLRLSSFWKILIFGNERRGNFFRFTDASILLKCRRYRV